MPAVPTLLSNSKVTGDQVINHPSMMKAADSTIKDYNNLANKQTIQFKAQFQKIEDDFLQESQK